MLEYRIHNNNFYKTSKSLPVVKVTFSDLVELLTDYDGNKKDKLMAVCECDDVDKLQDGDFINTINTLILSFGDDTIIQQTFKFNERYQINNVDRKEKSFSFFFDKYIKLDVERIVCGYQYFKPSEFFANRENDNIFLYCKSYHYFDTTDNLNENDEQEIPILFRYTNSDGELKDVTIKFRYYDYATLATSLSAFDDEPELFKILFNVNATVEVLGRTYYNVLPPIPEEDENEAPYGWKRSEYEENGIKYYAWIPKLSEYDLDAMEDIQAIQGSLNDIEVYRNTYLFTDRTFYEFNVERIFANINVPIINTFDNDIQQTDLINKYFVEAERSKVINNIVDIEKDVYYPCISVNNKLQDVYTIKFNLHFREHRTKDWVTQNHSFWNGVTQEFEYIKEWFDIGTNQYQYDIITPEQYNALSDDDKKEYTKHPKSGTASIESNITNSNASDLLAFIGITNDDVYYQRNKLKKSFLRLLFYDSTNPGNQNLIGYSTIFMDSGKLFSKYAKYINSEGYTTIDYAPNDYGIYSLSENKRGIRVNREKNFDEERRLSTQLSVSSKNTSSSSSDGFYLYIWKDNESTMPQDLFMKVEFNHAGYGRTIPFMMPFWDKHKWENDNTKMGIKTFQEIIDDWNSQRIYRLYTNPNSYKTLEQYGALNADEQSKYYPDWIYGNNGTDGHYGIRQYNKYSYIHLKYQYDKENDKHYYYIDPETYGEQLRYVNEDDKTDIIYKSTYDNLNSQDKQKYKLIEKDNEIIINLYEAKIE